MKRISIGILAWALTAILVMACDDPFGPGAWRPGDETPDTVELFSLSRPEYQGLPSAFDFTPSGRRRIAVELPGATGNWDVAITEENGRLVFLPPGALGDIQATAGVTIITDASFDALVRAPQGAGIYNDSSTVPIEEGGIYIVRTRQVPCGFFGSALFYAKVEALSVDLAEGTLQFRFIANPNCNDPALVPPEDE